jgi:hypothetical protein
VILAVLMVATFVFEVVDSSCRDHRIFFVAILFESQKLHHHISCKLLGSHTGMHLHVLCRVYLTDAVISDQLAQRMAMHCRLVYKITDLCPGFCTLRIGKALELVDGQVGGFEVLKPVCEKVNLCEKQEALLDVYVVLGVWSRLFGTFSRRILKGVRLGPRLFLRVVMPSIVFRRIFAKVEGLNSEIDAIQIPGEDYRVLVVQACRFGEFCPFRLASCLEET